MQKSVDEKLKSILRATFTLHVNKIFNLLELPMDSTRYLLFIITTAIMVATPGPTVLLTVMNGVTHGVKKGLVGILGNF